MPGYKSFGIPDPEEERRRQLLEQQMTDELDNPPDEMDLTQDPEALRGAPPDMDLTKDPEALDSPMLRAQQARQQPPPAAAYGGGLGGPGKLSSLLGQRDPEMDSRWRSAEQNALSRSGYAGNQQYGAGEAVRDFAPMAVGGALDIFLNKGRGLGALAGAGMQANALQERNRQTMAADAGKFAATARDQREAQGRGQLSAVTELRQQQQFDINNNPDNPAAVQMREKLITAGVPREMVEGATLGVMRANQSAYTPYFRHGAVDLQAGDARQIATARKGGEFAATDEHFPTRLNQETDIAANTAQARNAVDASFAPQRVNEAAAKETALNPIRLAGKEAEADAGVGAGSGNAGHIKVEDVIRDNPNLNFKNPQGLQDKIRTRALTAKVFERIAAANRGINLMDEMYSTMERAQAAARKAIMSGGTDLDAVSEADALRTQLQTHADEYAGIMGTVSGQSSEAQSKRDRDLVPSIANPNALARIKALWPALEVNIKGNLGTFGIEAHRPKILGGGGVDDDAQPPPAAAPQARQGAGMPKAGFGSNVNETLPVTDQRAGQVPKVPVQRLGGKPPAAGGGAANGGKAAAPRMRIIEDTSTGETESEMLTDEEAAAFMRANPGVQIR
jgi:hypothetical protein